MRSSAVFIASLSAAIAKPLDYTYPTFEIPPTFQAPSPLNFPEPAGTVGSIGTVGHNGLVAFAETTPPEPNPMNNPIGINYSPGAPAETTQSDTNFINNGIGINYLPQAPSTGDNYIISSAFGGGADQSPDTSAYSTYISQSAAPDRQRQFVDPAPIYWSKRESYQVFLDFDSYDSGTTTFICSEELLGCCGTTYQQAEDQAGIRKSVKGCSKYQRGKCQYDQIYCPRPESVRNEPYRSVVNRCTKNIDTQSSICNVAPPN